MYLTGMRHSAKMQSDTILLQPTIGSSFSRKSQEKKDVIESLPAHILLPRSTVTISFENSVYHRVEPFVDDPIKKNLINMVSTFCREIAATKK